MRCVGRETRVRRVSVGGDVAVDASTRRMRPGPSRLDAGDPATSLVRLRCAGSPQEREFSGAPLRVDRRARQRRGRVSVAEYGAQRGPNSCGASRPAVPPSPDGLRLVSTHNPSGSSPVAHRAPPAARQRKYACAVTSTLGPIEPFPRRRRPVLPRRVWLWCRERCHGL
jgi:hypothetical protein